MQETGYCKFDEVMVGFRMVRRDKKMSREKTAFSCMEARVKAALSLVEIFETLHGEGRHFNSVSHNDFLVDPVGGNVLLAVRDHVTEGTTGAVNNLALLAPEVVLEKAPLSDATDAYTLAILLFELFLRVHPMEGLKCNTGSSVTFEREAELYAEHPVFIFDPEDDSNRLSPSIREKVEKVWNSYPEYLRKAFTKSFTIGCRKEEQRISAKEWKHMLSFMEKALEKRRLKKSEGNTEA